GGDETARATYTRACLRVKRGFLIAWWWSDAEITKRRYLPPAAAWEGLVLMRITREEKYGTRKKLRAFYVRGMAVMDLDDLMTRWAHDHDRTRPDPNPDIIDIKKGRVLSGAWMRRSAITDIA